MKGYIGYFIGATIAVVLLTPLHPGAPVILFVSWLLMEVFDPNGTNKKKK